MALKVLSALDTAKTQYYHFKAIIVAGMGLFTDAYDLFCIPPIMKLIGRIYYDKTSKAHEKGVTPPSVLSISIGIALFGAAIGKVLFGSLGDKFGRRRVYGPSLMIMIISSLACGFSICGTTNCVLTSLIFFRFMLGVGIGGDYPISATIMSEFANKKTRGSFIAAVFSMQGFGIVVSSVVTIVVCEIFKHASKASNPTGQAPDEADLAWRLILMFGAIPAALTYYWRTMMPETARYTALVEQNPSQAVKDMEKVLDLSADEIEEYFDMVHIVPSYGIMSKQFIRQHGRDLFACASSWFLVAVVFYSSNLFQPQIFKKNNDENHRENVYQEAIDVARTQAILALCSTIPGYWATVYFIDRIGRVKIQLMGFLGMAVTLLAVGIPYYSNNEKSNWFYVLYGLTFFFSNFGPNTTTFIVPAELFPARFRTTCHGISGAAGKIGAIVGTVGFLWASQSTDKDEVNIGYHTGIGIRNTLVILAMICVLGMTVTYFCTRETMGRSLEENEHEEEESGNVQFHGCFTSSSERIHTSPAVAIVA